MIHPLFVYDQYGGIDLIVYLSGFDLWSSLILSHLALYQVCVRRLESLVIYFLHPCVITDNDLSFASLGGKYPRLDVNKLG